MTEDEKQDIEANDTDRIAHRAHLKKSDFERHGYIDRCPGCSAILRGLHVQPHSAACRARVETILDADIRVKNAKVRLKERGCKMERKGKDLDEVAKRKLDQIEEKALAEEDPQKLSELFENTGLSA